MFKIGLNNYDFLLIRFKHDGKIGYIRYNLRDELKPSSFETRKEAEEVLEDIRKNDYDFVNDTIKNSIVNGSNIDKSKLEIFEFN